MVAPRKAAERTEKIMTNRQAEAIRKARKEGYRAPMPKRLDDNAAYKKHGHGIPNATRRLVYKRDGYQCAMCSETRGLQIHHVWKRSLGGSDFPDNLITLCWKCHAIAHGMRFIDTPDYIDETWMEQQITEYISDYYVKETGEPWYPFK